LHFDNAKAADPDAMPSGLILHTYSFTLKHNHMINRTSLFIIICFISSFSHAQPDISRAEPPYWWIGMKNTSLQILLYGRDLGGLKPEIRHPGIHIDSIGQVPNQNYLFLYLTINDDTKAGKFDIDLLNQGRKILKIQYELKERRKGSAARKGFGQEDVIYLLMPDRFANGDTTNDSHSLMLEKSDRSNPDGRHGGDLKGIEDHLGYIAGLGMTALWINPFVENNTPAYSYHGYAITDFYKTDPRIGTNEEYVRLVKKAHDYQLKIIMDMVFNHCGQTHWFINDLPSPDWIHNFNNYTRSNFKAPVIMDPYASKADKSIMLDGWFDTHMPDLNQKNPHLAVYLTQNSIWWVEYADLDGIRMDTYMYPDPGFMAKWRIALKNEYPDLNVVGEIWIEDKTLHAYWMKDAPNNDGFNSELEYLTDFPLFDAIRKSLNESTGWNKGAERIYYCLAKDIAYKYPGNNLTFLTNHDVSQFYTIAGENFGKFRLGITLLLTLRGIPQLYQGVEILMAGDQEEGHGKMRKDFPGGWINDTLNAFTPEGRTPLQQEAFSYVKTIADWRKGCTAVQTGKTLQFIPENDVYVYFRYNEKQTIMIVMNFSDNERTITTERFSEIIKGCRTGKEIISGKNISDITRLTIPALTSLIIELDK